MEFTHEIFKTLLLIIIAITILVSIVSNYLTKKILKYYENRNNRKQAKSQRPTR